MNLFENAVFHKHPQVTQKLHIFVVPGRCTCKHDAITQPVLGTCGEVTNDDMCVVGTCGEGTIIQPLPSHFEVLSS
jgi:hypothetical protein